MPNEQLVGMEQPRGRPRGVSANIPQEAIDEMMRDDPTVPVDRPRAQTEFPTDRFDFNQPPADSEMKNEDVFDKIDDHPERLNQMIPEQPKKVAPALREIVLPDEP